MKLRILNVAFPFAPVGPDAVGGAEQVLTQIDAALVLEGHDSFVVACKGSKALGQLRETIDVPHDITEDMKRKVYLSYRAAIQDAITEFDVDLVHFHGVDFQEYLPDATCPMLATLHLPLNYYPGSIHNLPKNVWLHCVSEPQQRGAVRDARWLSPIENGVPIPSRTEHARRNFVFALGRICPEKGFHYALEAAKRANVRCYLGGEVFPYQTHMNYFEKEIRPREDRWRRFIGPVGVGRKKRFLSAARCVLVPSRAAETSSLVTMEAMAHGTSVIAFRSGALPSLITEGITGFIVDSVEEMAEAIHWAEEISPETCRKVARERFSLERMTHQYLDRYEELITARFNAGIGNETLAFA